MQFDRWKRREFMTLLGGAVAAWQLPARAQEPGRSRRIGALMAEAEDAAESRTRKAAFEEGLSQLGWKPGRTIAIDYRWAVYDLERGRVASAELLELNPDLLLTAGTSATKAALLATRTIPIVFAGVSEPVSQGIVASLSHPGGNATGFTYLEPTLGTKWLELVKEIAPSVARVGILFNPDTAPYAMPVARATEVAAPRFAVKPETIAVRSAAEIEAAIVRIASEPGGGVVFPPDTYTSHNSKLIIELCERYRLPAIYSLKFMATAGGLAFYGVDIVDEFRAAADYVDRIMKGKKPADLAVQQPTKYELVLNLKTAKALGLTVPHSLLVAADEVIE
jgi:putative ABC transport system substrate-binding protein